MRADFIVRQCTLDPDQGIPSTLFCEQGGFKVESCNWANELPG